nr:hypothetical protein [Tanacetum cinerariifolium]
MKHRSELKLKLQRTKEQLNEEKKDLEIERKKFTRQLNMYKRYCSQNHSITRGSQVSPITCVKEDPLSQICLSRTPSFNDYATLRIILFRITILRLILFQRISGSTCCTMDVSWISRRLSSVRLLQHFSVSSKQHLFFGISKWGLEVGIVRHLVVWKWSGGARIVDIFEEAIEKEKEKDIFDEAIEKERKLNKEKLETIKEEMKKEGNEKLAEALTQVKEHHPTPHSVRSFVVQGPHKTFSIQTLELPGPIETQSSPVEILELKMVMPVESAKWIPSVFGLVADAKMLTPCSLALLHAYRMI